MTKPLKETMDELHGEFAQVLRLYKIHRETNLLSAMAFCAVAAAVDDVASERGDDRLQALAVGLAAVGSAGAEGLAE